MIVPASAPHTPALLALAEATGIFQPGEVDLLLGGTLSKLHAGGLGLGHQARVWVDDSSRLDASRLGASSEPRGWTYFGPSDKADGVWDLWWIGVHPEHQGKGVGRALLRDCEARARAEHGRLLLIETSAAPALLPTRAFYLKQGYAQCGQIPDFYGEGDDKIIFAKKLENDLGNEKPSVQA